MRNRILLIMKFAVEMRVCSLKWEHKWDSKTMEILDIGKIHKYYLSGNNCEPTVYKKGVIVINNTFKACHPSMCHSSL